MTLDELIAELRLSIDEAAKSAMLHNPACIWEFGESHTCWKNRVVIILPVSEGVVTEDITMERIIEKIASWKWIQSAENITNTVIKNTEGEIVFDPNTSLLKIICQPLKDITFED
jgi:hypothetical protein